MPKTAQREIGERKWEGVEIEIEIESEIRNSLKMSIDSFGIRLITGADGAVSPVKAPVLQKAFEVSAPNRR